ncbi:MAG: bifunctional (p)ppGpp synthetase/guanosine-3',5'-bis(diphosphate) 3'-pyrophosphohydrolase [Planctomycetes bacterium]|nr:bifunctional (p)ppGpp synthetase/guanosine-3',5'-bis(diphosphate) 3'-pyrophosphohydrolase [Planctomycetota bacterium]
MDFLHEAIAFAARKHSSQLRKDRATPYVVHPIRVMLVVLREFGQSDPNLLAAAVLHDTLEDTSADYDDLARLFNPTVASYVALLTKDKRLEEEVREDRYFAGLAGAPLPVKFCKVADTLDNLRDVKYGGDKEKTLAKARRLLSLFGSVPELGAALDLLRSELSA